MSEYFVKLPHAAVDLLINHRITSVGIRLYLFVLKSLNNKTGVFIGTTQKLMEVLNCSRWTLGKERTKLVKIGLLCFKNNGKSKPGFYSLPYTSKPAEKFKKVKKPEMRDEVKRFDSTR